MNYRITSVLSLLLAMVFILGGCRIFGKPIHPVNSNPPAPLAGESEAADALPSEDRAGRPITLPADIKRIVSMSPAVTEMLVDFGLADRLVAVDKYSIQVDGVDKNLPVFDMMSPDAEQIVALKADLVLSSSLSRVGGTDPFKPVSDSGVCVAYIPSSTSIAAIEEDVLFIGAVFGERDKAQSIVDDMRAQVAQVAAIAETISERRYVYFEIMSGSPLYSFGKGTFLDEIITLAGAENILASQESWCSVSDEIILAANPDVIITNWSEGEDITGEIVSRGGWDAITAVREGRVYAVDRNLSSRSNHRVTQAMWQIARAVYPEYYPVA